MQRREMLKAAVATAGACSLGREAAAGEVAAAGSVYARLGVKPVINGMGTVTVLGGSLMPPEVVRAMDEASRHFVHLPDLQRKAGARIAELVGVPAAMVTAGAASAITVATAVAMSRGDARRIAQLPDPTGMPFEVIQQKSHRSGYEAQVRAAGATVVVVETREELDRAITGRTAMMFFLNWREPEGKIKRDEWVRVARERGVVSFNDAAADVPPREHLSQYVREGFDLVAFSGGKGLRGPQCSGLLLGRADLIEGARTLVSPHGGVGRGMKVGKEEIAGIVAAVERYVALDLEAERRALEAKVDEMKASLGAPRGVALETFVPQIANHVPHLRLSWDESARNLTAKQAHERLQAGDPPIHVLLSGPGTLTVSVWTMRGDEHRTVALRLGEIFAGA